MRGIDAGETRAVALHEACAVVEKRRGLLAESCAYVRVDVRPASGATRFLAAVLRPGRSRQISVEGSGDILNVATDTYGNGAGERNRTVVISLGS